jgi:signal transduction histidine kinase
LAIVLLASFGLGIPSFIASTIIVRSRAAGIGTAAEGLAINSEPSLGHLSAMRTQLRHMEVTLDDWADRVALGQPRGHGDEAVRAERAELEHEWEAYLKLPLTPAEREHSAGIGDELQAMDSSLGVVTGDLAAGDGASAERILEEQTKPAIDHLDDDLASVVSADARSAAALGARIIEIRRSTRLMSNILYAVSGLFALIAAVAAFRAVRRYASAMEYRVSELEHFAGRVAHDIRSPLNALSLLLGVLERGAPLDEKRQAMMERGSRTLQRVAQVVDGLLVFARAGAIPRQDEVADLPEVLAGVAEEMAHAAAAGRVTVEVEPPPPCAVACSPGVLISILSNLVGNALKYLGDAPSRRVLLRVRLRRRRARVEVLDTGPGIPLELKERIFDPYVRGAASAIPGLGLGLATVRRLVEAHRGEVGVDSHLGHGSRFWFELPVAGP